MHNLFRDLVLQYANNWDLTASQTAQLQRFVNCMDMNLSETELSHIIETILDQFIVGGSA